MGRDIVRKVGFEGVREKVTYRDGPHLKIRDWKEKLEYKNEEKDVRRENAV